MNSSLTETERNENELLYGNEMGQTGYQGQDLSFKRANINGDDDNIDLTESEILVKTMQEVFIFYLFLYFQTKIIYNSKFSLTLAP